MSRILIDVARDSDPLCYWTSNICLPIPKLWWKVKHTPATREQGEEPSKKSCYILRCCHKGNSCRIDPGCQESELIVHGISFGMIQFDVLPRVGKRNGISPRVLMWKFIPGRMEMIAEMLETVDQFARKPLNLKFEYHLEMWADEQEKEISET